MAKSPLNDTAAATIDGLKDKVVPAVSHAAAVAKDLSAEYAQAAGEWARPHLEQGRHLAAPAVASAQHAASAAAQALGPVVEEAKEKVEAAVPSLTDRVEAMWAAGNAARTEALTRGTEAAMVLTGEATVKRTSSKKLGGLLGGMLAGAGMLAAAAAVAGYLARRSRDREDPWAQPLADPYIAPSTGRESTVAGLPQDEMAEAVADDEGMARPDVDTPEPPTEAAGEDGAGADATELIETPGDETPPVDPDHRP